MARSNFLEWAHLKPSNKGLVALYWVQLLKNFARKLVAFFVPIYLFKLGMELWGGLVPALSLVFWFYLSYRLVFFIVLFPAARAIRQFGYRWSVLVGTLLWVGFFLMLSMVETNVWLLLPAVVLMGLSTPLYWLSYHTLFTEEGEVDHFGGAVGWMAILESLSAIVGPFVGAVIATVLGFKALFWVGVIIGLLSAMPLFYLKHHKHADKVSFKEMVEWLKEARFRKASFSFVGRYIYDAMSSVVWPVYVFLVVGDLERTGLIFSLVMIVSVMAVVVAGKVFDKSHSKGVFAVGSVVTAIFWLVRATLSTFGQILVVDGIDKVNSAFYWLPYNAFMYLRAKGKQAFSFMVYREFFISLGGAVFWGLLLLMVQYEWRWYVIFGVGAVGVMMSQFILEREE